VGAAGVGEQHLRGAVAHGAERLGDHLEGLVVGLGHLEGRLEPARQRVLFVLLPQRPLVRLDRLLLCRERGTDGAGRREVDRCGAEQGERDATSDEALHPVQAVEQLRARPLRGGERREHSGEGEQHLLEEVRDRVIDRVQVLGLPRRSCWVVHNELLRCGLIGALAGRN
jgi:hypothetical protein